MELVMAFPNPIVSVVIPCLDEEDSIADVVREVLAQGVNDLVVVDNGSTDATAQRARAAGARVVHEPHRGYGRACAAGIRSIRADTDVTCFLDGDGSDVPAFLPDLIDPIARDEVDFALGSRLRGSRQQGSMTPQQIVAGWLAGRLLGLAYGVSSTDMSPFRAIRTDALRRLGMTETTYGWNIEMQVRAAASGLRFREIAVDHRRRSGGVSKVSGNLVASVKAAFAIAATFGRLTVALRRAKARSTAERSVAR
jgi:glycosyltransferase involved in cell wall biosynthesis